MRKIVVIAVISVLLVACATEQLNSGLRSLVGSNIQMAINVMGYPDSEREVAGQKIYLWSTNRTDVLPMATTATTAGAVGGTPYYGTTTGMELVPFTAACKVQIAVNAQGVIQTFQWEGNEAGCARYARRFH